MPLIDNSDEKDLTLSASPGSEMPCDSFRRGLMHIEGHSSQAFDAKTALRPTASFV